VEEALEGATFVQENAPENMDVKHAMLRQVRKTPSWPGSWQTSAFYSCILTGTHGTTCIFWDNLTPSSLQIDEALPTDVIVGSSTSSFLLLDMVADCTRAPERFVLSHPFNPPHLMPLVELFGTSSPRP
jgi:3-hydroxyacyl-CoA dehydrogenase